MLTDYDINQIGNHAQQGVLNPEDATKLIQEIHRMRQYLLDYNSSITKQIDSIEANMLLLEAENSRLLMAKSIVYVERDSCIAFLAQLALAKQFRVGTAADHTIVVDLPSGQVSWQFHESEAHLFADFPAYEEAVEELTIQETYRRVMNPGITL
jgi:hypothetical protein